jgi:hypothetical protein
MVGFIFLAYSIATAAKKKKMVYLLCKKSIIFFCIRDVGDQCM